MELPEEELPLEPQPPVASPAPACVVLGRFQPFHRGHIALIEDAYPRKHCGIFRIVIGSSNRMESEQNPWTWRERVQMIESWLAVAHPDWDVEIVAVPDIDDPPNWVHHATRFHGEKGTLFTSDEKTAELYQQAGWPVEMCGFSARERLQGWRVRSTLKMLSMVHEQEAVRSVLGESLDESVVEWMLQEDRLRRLAFIGPPIEPVG